jgi:hypothetical protein
MPGARPTTDSSFEISNVNTASAIDFFAHLFGLVGFAEKLATGTGEPIKKHVARVLHQAS